MDKKRVATFSRNEWVVAALVLVLLAALVLRPSIRGNDGYGNYVYLASLLGDGDLDFTDDYQHIDELRDYPYRFADLPVNPETGRASNRYGIGSALLWSPAVATIHGVLRLAASDSPHLTSRPYEWAVGVATAAWGSLGLLLLYARLRRTWGHWACAGTIAGLIFATPLGFYLYAHGSMSHGTGFFAATALLLAFERAWQNARPGTLAVCGAFGALLIIIRFQDAPWAFLACGALAGRQILCRPTSRSTWLGIGAMAAAGAVVSLPQLAVWRILYGSWFSGPLPYLDASAGSFEPWPRHLLAVLVSERGGVLVWHPAIAAGLVGLVLLARRSHSDRPVALYGLAGFAALLWVVASWSMWWGGASFGNRFFISFLPAAAPGGALLLHGGGERRRQMIAACVLALAIVWNMGLLYQYATEMVPREDPVPWSHVIRQNVIDVPRALLGKVRGQ